MKLTCSSWHCFTKLVGTIIIWCLIQRVKLFSCFCDWTVLSQFANSLSFSLSCEKILQCRNSFVLTGIHDSQLKQTHQTWFLHVWQRHSLYSYIIAYTYILTLSAPCFRELLETPFHFPLPVTSSRPGMSVQASTITKVALRGLHAGHRPLRAHTHHTLLTSRPLRRLKARRGHSM